MKKYDQINAAFEKAVTRLQENLQYMADNHNASDRFLSFHNAIIKALIDYQQQTERIISGLEFDVAQLSQGKLKELEQLKVSHTSLEAICIIHGIMDFPAWLSKGMDYLVNEAVEMHRSSNMLLPSEFLKMIEGSHILTDGKTIEGILFNRSDIIPEEKVRRIVKELETNHNTIERLKDAKAQGNKG